MRRPQVARMIAAAILFHDAILVPGADDNEARSAELWRRAARRLRGFTPAEIAWVADTIRATADHLNARCRMASRARRGSGCSTSTSARSATRRRSSTATPAACGPRRGTWTMRPSAGGSEPSWRGSARHRGCCAIRNCTRPSRRGRGPISAGSCGADSAVAGEAAQRVRTGAETPPPLPPPPARAAASAAAAASGTSAIAAVAGTVGDAGAERGGRCAAAVRRGAARPAHRGPARRSARLPAPPPVAAPPRARAGAAAGSARRRWHTG